MLKILGIKYFPLNEAHNVVGAISLKNGMGRGFYVYVNGIALGDITV